MFRLETVKYGILWMIWLTMFWFQSNIFAYDLLSEINTNFKNYYDKWVSDEYLEDRYEPVYSKDPFADALKNREKVSAQKKIAWVKYVEKALSEIWCANVLSKKRIRWILYHFVPEFRMDIARSLKIQLWDYDSFKYLMDVEEVWKYCTKFYNCKNVKNDYKEESTSNTSENVWNNCQEFFTTNYNKWASDENMLQELKLSNVWDDKYWNSSTDDSPYDVMSDMWVLGRLLFEDFQPAVQPVFYNLPIFSNSMKSMEDRIQSQRDGTWWVSTIKDDAEEIENSDWWSDWNQGEGEWGAKKLVIIPLSNPEPLSNERIDDLREWLLTYSLWKNTSSFGSKMCEDTDTEIETEIVGEPGGGGWDFYTDDGGLDLSEEESQEVIESMAEALKWYGELSNQKYEEIKNASQSINKTQEQKDPSEIEKLATEIKDCWKWCEWLRVDQKASCMVMCTCGDINSPIFDPEKNPWLWPLFRIRFCSVPAVDMKFSVWGIKMSSVEKWVKEIYGVVDKLSREGKLWIRTQQYNFLDSTTKKTKVADTFAFSIWVEWVDIASKQSNYSIHYKQYLAEKENKKLQEMYDVSHSLDNPVLKNHYSMMRSIWDNITDFKALSNADAVRQDRENLNNMPTLFVDQINNSRASRYGDISLDLDLWADQHANFWVEVLWYVKDTKDYAQVLYSKKQSK